MKRDAGMRKENMRVFVGNTDIRCCMHQPQVMKSDAGMRKENMRAIVINTDIGCCMHHMHQPHLQVSSLNNN